MALSIGQSVFCDCGMDILEYSVKEVRQSADMTTYVLRSKKGVGQHRFIDILVFENKEGEIRFMQIEYTELDDCEFGLAPFTNGKYFTELRDAKISFARTQIQVLDDDTRRMNERIKSNNQRKERWMKIVES